MNNQDNENLRQLLGKFLDTEKSRQIRDDISFADKVLRENPAPQPASELIDKIKSQIGKALLQKRTQAFRKAVYKVAAVAAVFMLIVIISVKLFEKDTNAAKVIAIFSPIQVNWETDEAYGGDANLATLAAEIDDIENALLALQADTGNGQESWELTDIESELIEIDSDFWKG